MKIFGKCLEEFSEHPDTKQLEARLEDMRKDYKEMYDQHKLIKPTYEKIITFLDDYIELQKNNRVELIRRQMEVDLEIMKDMAGQRSPELYYQR